MCIYIYVYIYRGQDQHALEPQVRPVPARHRRATNDIINVVCY